MKIFSFSASFYLELILNLKELPVSEDGLKGLWKGKRGVLIRKRYLKV